MAIQRYDVKQRMSRAVIHSGTVYFCGQVPKDCDAGIEEQTRSTLEKIDELLASVGSDKSKLLSCTIYIKDMAYFQGMNGVWDRWVPEGFAPARACVQAAMARPEILVEISVIAAA